MMIFIAAASVLVSAIIYIPIWLPIVFLVNGADATVLFYMLFALLSFPLDFFISVIFSAYVLRR